LVIESIETYDFDVLEFTATPARAVGRRWSHMKRYILYAIAILATWTLIDAVAHRMLL